MYDYWSFPRVFYRLCLFVTQLTQSITLSVSSSVIVTWKDGPETRFCNSATIHDLRLIILSQNNLSRRLCLQLMQTGTGNYTVHAKLLSLLGINRLTIWIMTFFTCFYLQAWRLTFKKQMLTEQYKKIDKFVGVSYNQTFSYKRRTSSLKDQKIL